MEPDCGGDCVSLSLAFRLQHLNANTLPAAYLRIQSMNVEIRMYSQTLGLGNGREVKFAHG